MVSARTVLLLLLLPSLLSVRAEGVSKNMTASMNVTVPTASPTSNNVPTASSPSNINASCPASCGGVTVPYPFGLAPGCSRDDDFQLACNQSYNPPRTMLNGLQVTEIQVGRGQLSINMAEKIKINGTSWPSAGHYSVGVLDWIVDHLPCEVAANSVTNYACISTNSVCREVSLNGTVGYRCECSPGYQGNPYISDSSDSCIDIDECREPNVCVGNCINTPGSFICSCPLGTVADPKERICVPHKHRSDVSGVIIGVSIGFVLLLLFISVVYFQGKWKERNIKKLKEKHFNQNRGFLLQQLISSDGDDVTEKMKIISLDELEKATNNFDDSRILGRGGHGTVYKGILSDQRVVAIKKSKIEIQSEIDQFINELAILSQINHRNIVKLFGCCLKTQVPLLVYEFISNGTLSEHLHVWDRNSSLSWEDRLRIATETAGALAYIHSAASISIFHRDVKSSNILLTENFTAKVSDFGASRTIALDQTRITTLVQGTFGYLDPEYFHTSQLTEKSDVYSFGVILVELLTGEKPISSSRAEEQRNISMYFILSLKENRLFQVVEPRIIEEGTREELEVVAKLAEKCLRLKGEERPTMKEVEKQLDELRRSKRHR